MKRGFLYREESTTFTSKWKRQYFCVERGTLRVYESEAMNVQQLATSLNEKPQVIQQYENGQAIPNPQIISKIERALGVKLPRKKK